MSRANDYTSESDIRLLFERQGGKCSARECQTQIHLIKPRDFIIEHENQLALSGDNSLSNKTLRCIDCAHRKTFGTKATSYGSDAHARAKVRRIVKKAGAPKKPSRMQGRGFQNPPEGYKHKWPKRKFGR